jgi:hypothetical protein
MQMPTPAAAHQELERFVGTWRGEEQIFPSPFDPAGGTAIGRVRNVRALDGFAVVQDYEQERGGAVNFRGHGVFRYDPGQSRYEVHWFDSFGANANIMTGQFKGAVLTLENTTGHRMRANWDFGTPGRYAYRMEISPDGTNWMPFMAGTYVRET